MKRFIFLLALTLTFTSLIQTSSVFALEYGGIGGKPANPNPNNPRTKSIFLFNLAGGQTDRDSVLIINNTSEQKTLSVYATDSQKSTDGSFACEQFLDTKDLVGSWITLEKTEVVLEASTTEEIPFTLTLPENVDVGETNGCIMIQEKKPEASQDASGVSLSFRTGLRVVVTVPGEQIRKLDIKSFSAEFDGTVVKTKMDVENTGNVSIDSDIKIDVNSIFGTAIENVHNEFPILRGEVSTYNIEMARPFWGGLFTLTPSVDYDSSDTAEIGVDAENKTTATFPAVTIFIMPSGLALAVEAVALITLIVLCYFLIKRIRINRQISNNWVQYVVKPGDTVNSIADKNGIDWKLLARANSIKPPYTLVTGTTIKIPSKLL